ncbi:MAG: ATP-binding protein [Synergistetes bacterium]|nr:ATP-binding protein [Synergistota bacterium]MCX8127640.1 ATP-binding protein [Synergistota bacterium]MDW8191444.1 ATP-binding protein [Synergistota bacterium]
MEDFERKIKDLREAYEEVIRLYRITEEVGLAPSIEAIKNLFLNYVTKLAPSINEKYLILGSEIPEKISEKWKIWEEEGLIEWVKNRGKTTIIPEDNLTYVLTPLVVRNKIIGMSLVSTSVCPEGFNQQVLNLLDTIAHQCAVGIENIRLHKEIDDIRKFLQELFDQLPHGILVLEINGKIKSANRKLLELIELKDKEPRDVLGKRVEEVLPDILSLKIREVLTETVIKVRVSEEEVSYIENDREITLGISSTLFRQNEDQGIILIVRDLSESKELEKLRRLDKLKSEFISSVSHELKTPLTAIKGFIELLLDNPESIPSETAKAYLSFMNEEVNNLTRLINDLLDFSRLETSKLYLELEEFDINELIERAVSMFERDLKEKELFIYKELNGDLPLVKGDKGKLLQVLINLIDNAIKYIGNGKRIWIRANADDGKGITICVEDEGIGIPPESLPYIFDKFYRVESDYTHKIRGLGLGLSIAKQIIEAHKGKIWAESKPDKGSKFFFYLPIIEKEES